MEFANQIMIDKEKCIGCGLCKQTCLTMLLDLDEKGKAFSKPVEKLNWYGCIGCQHCLAVCPTGAISVYGKDPENSLPMPDKNIDMGDMMDRLIAGRRSCRHFKQENVDPALIDHMLTVLQNAPTGGNKMLVEYTIIDDIDTMNRLRALVDNKYRQLWDEGIFPPTWDQESMSIHRSREEQAMNGDMYFCSAPHYFVAHMPSKFNSAQVDSTITLAYFELLCHAHGLGTVYLGFPKNILNLMPEIKALLGIPEDHCFASSIGFGYPIIEYARGVQKDGVKIHRVKTYKTETN